METCKACGARLSGRRELYEHNAQQHPGKGGKKGGDLGQERKPDRDRPID